VTAGVQIRGDDSFPLGDQNRDLSLAEAEAVVLSAGFRARAHPGYDPRFALEQSFGGGNGGAVVLR